MTTNMAFLEIDDYKNMLSRAKKFYEKLYTPDTIDVSAQNILLSQLLHYLNVIYEFTDAVTKMKSNKVPIY